MLNIASVFIYSHKDLFIEEYVTNKQLFGKRTDEAYEEAEKIYNKFLFHVFSQF
jgi:hypothetical protein